MITLTLRCPYCASDRLIRYGVTAKGQHRENPGSNAYSAAERDTILRAYAERSSLRGLSRTFGVSRNTVTAG